jgi:hypothetical protein
MSPGSAMQWHGMRVIARGANRICVLDPDLPGHCLKYELQPVPGMRRYWRRRLRHAISRRLPGLGLNATELAAWQRLHARLGKTLEEHVAPCVGIVHTPAGLALRARLVADAEGGAAPTIAALLADGSTTFDFNALARALDGFQAWLLADRIPLSDLNAGNFAVVCREGEPQLVCVDLKSTLSGRGLVPLYRWSWTLMRRKILRRCERLRGQLEAAAGGDPLADPTALP